MSEVILTSKNKDKIHAIEKFGQSSGIKVVPTPTDGCDAIPEQPFNSGRMCSLMRLLYVLIRDSESWRADRDIQFYTSIENGLVCKLDPGDWAHGPVSKVAPEVYDICYATLLFPDGRIYYGKSKPIAMDPLYLKAACRNTRDSYDLSDLGFEVTAGKMIARMRPSVLSGDWMGHKMFMEQMAETMDIQPQTISRADQIQQAVDEITPETLQFRREPDSVLVQSVVREIFVFSPLTPVETEKYIIRVADSAVKATEDECSGVSTEYAEFLRGCALGIFADR